MALNNAIKIKRMLVTTISVYRKWNDVIIFSKKKMWIILRKYVLAYEISMPKCR